MTDTRQREERAGRRPVAPSCWRETAAVLALFAMVLSVVAGLVPMPPMPLGALAGDPASQCAPGKDLPDDHPSGPDGPRHNCLCCLTSQFNGFGILPGPPAEARPVLAAAAAPARGSDAPRAGRPVSDSQPRAPPIVG